VRDAFEIGLREQVFGAPHALHVSDSLLVGLIQ
jgi:hypothetical protein